MTRDTGVSQLQLKLLALVSMTIDHTAGVFGSQVFGTLYAPMRAVGRMAFPLYCFMLVEGFYHTRDVKKYLERLLLAFCLSELPFDWALYRTIPGPRCNVMMTLALGLVTILALERGREALSQQDSAAFSSQAALYFGVISAGMGAAFLLKTDYRGGGVLLIVLFYLFRGQLWALLTTIPPVLLIFYNPQELWGAAALLPIALYNGERGKGLGPRAQRFFYLYYPLHLAVLALLRAVLLHTPVAVFGRVV